LVNRLCKQGMTLLATACLLFAGVCFGRSSSPPVLQQTTPTHDIRVKTELVALAVSATDRHGNFVSGLPESDFRVYEDSHLQHIALFAPGDVPVTVGILVDHSGSMAPRLDQVVAAAAAFVKSSNPQDEIFVENFNENVRPGLPPGIEFSSDINLLASAILGQPAEGETALYDAISAGLRTLRDGHGRRQALLIVTDGGDNASSISLRDITTLAGRSNAPMYFIGISDPNDEDSRPRILKRLAKITGGRAYFPQFADQVGPLCRQIARDIREQYTIGYVPSASNSSGAFHKIRVAVSAPGHGKLQVHTRAGYFSDAGSIPQPTLASEKP